MATMPPAVTARRWPPGASALRSILYVLVFAATAAGAQNMYKCSNAGKVEYSDKPCPSGEVVKQMAPDGGPTREERARAHMRSNAVQADLDASAKAAKQAPEKSPRVAASAGTDSHERK